MYVGVSTREWRPEEMDRAKNVYTFDKEKNKFVKNWQDKGVWAMGS